LAVNPGWASLLLGLDSSYSSTRIENGLVEPDTTQVSCCEPNRQTRTVVVLPDHPQVPPDNAEAFTAISCKRKVSGGSRSIQRFAQTANTVGADLSATGTFGHRVSGNL